jgi:hypothetical protein
VEIEDSLHRGSGKNVSSPSTGGRPAYFTDIDFVCLNTQDALNVVISDGFLCGTVFEITIKTVTDRPLAGETRYGTAYFAN